MQRFFIPSADFAPQTHDAAARGELRGNTSETMPDCGDKSSDNAFRAAPGGTINIFGDDAHHIADVLRMSVGDRVICCDMSRVEYDCRIKSISRGKVELEVISAGAADTEPPAPIALYQALPKGDKMDIIVQKAVETGVNEIIPFISERCISRPDAEGAAKKVARWQKIAAEAAKQCGRSVIPRIHGVTSFSEAAASCKNVSDNGIAFICYEGDGTLPLGELIRGKNYCEYRFMIGSEGGFSQKEFEAAKNAGLRPAGLGKRILRCETAPSFVLACICYENEL